MKFFANLSKYFIRHGGSIAKYAAIVILTSSVTIYACRIAFERLERKHRAEDAKRYKKEFKKSLKDLEERYAHNEYLLKKRINDLCKEYGIENIF